MHTANGKQMSHIPIAGRLLMYLNNDTHITADAAVWQFHSTCSLEISTGLQTKLSTNLKHTVTL